MSKRVRGSGRTFPRGNRWWISYYLGDGVEHREPGGDTEKAAQALLTDRLAASGRGEPVTPEAGRLTVKDAVENWYATLVERKAKGLAGARCTKQHLIELLGHVRIARLTPTLVRRLYIEPRRADTIADGTIRRELHSLTGALNLLRKEQRITHVPYLPKPPASPARQAYPEPEVLAAILPHLTSEATKDAILYADATGRRKGEVITLAWTQVYLRDGEIRYGDTKNDDPLTIPIDGVVAAVIARRVKARRMECEFVFHDDGRALTPKTLLARFKAACAAAGTAIHTVHDLRRSGVRNLVRGGASEAVAMSISGHKDRDIFRRYNISSVEDQRAALRSVAAYRAARISEVRS